MYMPTNDPVYQKAYKDKHYAANKQRYVEQAAARKVALRLEIQQVKSVPCADCKQAYPYWVMDFDHVRGEKINLINRMVANAQREKVFAEIEKCDVVCSNCHRERTHQREQAGVV